MILEADGGAASPPIEQVGPAHVFEAASHGKQGVAQALYQQHPARLDRLPQQRFPRRRSRPASGRSLIVFIQSFRSLYCGPAAFTAASAYWTAWNRLRTKVASCAGKASSQALRIPGAPSDRHRQFLGREHAVPEPELLQAGTKSEARLMPFTAFAPSMQTPTAPLPCPSWAPRLSMLEQNYQSPVILAKPALGMQGCRVIRRQSYAKTTAIAAAADTSAWVDSRSDDSIPEIRNLQDRVDYESGAAAGLCLAPKLPTMSKLWPLTKLW